MIKLQYVCDACGEIIKEIDINVVNVCKSCSETSCIDKYANIDDVVNFIKEYFKLLGFNLNTYIIEQVNPILLYVRLSYGKGIIKFVDLEISLSKNVISFMKDNYKFSIPRRTIATPFYLGVNKNHPGFMFISNLISLFIFNKYGEVKQMVGSNKALRIKRTEHNRKNFGKLLNLLEDFEYVVKYLYINFMEGC